MNQRVAVLGNCQAQYIAAALTHFFPELDVKVVGKPFDGPIHFKGTKAKFLHSAELVDWLLADGSRKIVIRQTTPMVNTKFKERLTVRGVNFDLILMPYIEFRTLLLKKTEPRFGLPLIRAQMRADEISNKICLTKASLPEATHDRFLAEISTRPCTYTHNHLDGSLFHTLLACLDLAPLEASVGAERLANFLETVRQDPGIPHKHSGTPVQEVCEQMKILWAEDVMREAQEMSRMPYAAFRAFDWMPRGNEYSNYIAWRMLIYEAKSSGETSAIRKCLHMYHQDRQYVVWCRNLAEWFISVNQQGRAALVVASRMIQDDTRGLLLRWVLDNLKVFEESAVAKRIFGKAARMAPTSNARIVFDILEALG